jgi:hypothetical protein
MSTDEPERTPGEAWDEEGGAQPHEPNEFARRLLADDPDGPQPEETGHKADEDGGSAGQDDDDRFDAG